MCYKTCILLKIHVILLISIKYSDNKRFTVNKTSAILILGIGTDIFEVKRMKSRLEKQPSFIKGIFTDNEIRYCNQFKNKAQRYAARYAAKEALLKALGTGWRNGISFKDIDIINNELGKPNIKLSGIAKKVADKLEVTSIHLSISHTDKLANAFVIINNHK